MLSCSHWSWLTAPSPVFQLFTKVGVVPPSGVKFFSQGSYDHVFSCIWRSEVTGILSCHSLVEYTLRLQHLPNGSLSLSVERVWCERENRPLWPLCVICKIVGPWMLGLYFCQCWHILYWLQVAEVRVLQVCWSGSMWTLPSMLLWWPTTRQPSLRVRLPDWIDNHPQ